MHCKLVIDGPSELTFCSATAIVRANEISHCPPESSSFCFPIPYATRVSLDLFLGLGVGNFSGNRWRL